MCVCMCVCGDACFIAADCMDGYVCVYLCAIENDKNTAVNTVSHNDVVCVVAE